MKKIEKVKTALENKTRNTDNYITLTTATDARHSNKYTTKNVATNNTAAVSYTTLNKVIEKFELEI